jgi:hypothetical protein
VAWSISWETGVGIWSFEWCVIERMRHLLLFTQQNMVNQMLVDAEKGRCCDCGGSGALSGFGPWSCESLVGSGCFSPGLKGGPNSRRRGAVSSDGAARETVDV